MPVSEMVKSVVGWVLIFGGIGAALGRSRRLTATGLLYGLVLGPIGWLCVLLKAVPVTQKTGGCGSYERGKGKLTRQKHRALIWAGLALSVLTLMAWLFTAPVRINYVHADTPSRPGPRGGVIATEYVTKVWISHGVFAVQRTFRVVGTRSVENQTGLHIKTNGAVVSGLLPSIPFPWLDTGGPGLWHVRIPFWIPFLFFAIPSAYLLNRHRHIPPHGCISCQYDLTGNTSGVCPECGDRIR